jgi:hypothetical protein
MKNLRTKRLGELLASPRFNGDRTALYQAAGITKGRLSQLFDPIEPFGDVAAKNLCDALGLPQGWFDAAPSTKINDDLTQSGAIPLDYGTNPAPAAESIALGAINISANRRATLNPVEVVDALCALLAGVDPNTLRTVTAMLVDLASDPRNTKLAGLLSNALTPEAFTQPAQRTG